MNWCFCLFYFLQVYSDIMSTPILFVLHLSDKALFMSLFSIWLKDSIILKKILSCYAEKVLELQDQCSWKTGNEEYKMHSQSIQWKRSEHVKMLQWKDNRVLFLVWPNKLLEDYTPTGNMNSRENKYQRLPQLYEGTKKWTKASRLWRGLTIRETIG